MVSKDEIGSAYKSGFTLTELSIVMMILSLMVALTLSGKGLVDSAFIRSINREKSQYELLITSFNDVYGFMPGSDMSYQKSYKVKNIAQSNLFYDITSVISNQSVVDYVNNPYQIMNASILLRKYDSTLSTQNTSSAGVVITNYKAIPYSVISKYIMTSAAQKSAGWIFGIEPINNPMQNNFLVLTGVNNSASSFAWNGIPSMTTKNARNIDKKFDDGIPNMGNVRSYSSALNSTCTVSGNMAKYDNKNIDMVANGCVMSYKIAV